MELDTLRTDTRYLISPQLTSDQYGDTALDRNLNRGYHTVLGWILPIQGDWEISGDVIYRDTQPGVSVYELPQNLVRIFKGEIMYETGGSFVPITFINVQANQGTVEGNSTRTIDDTAFPTAELTGDTIEVKPAPTAGVVNGFKLWAQLTFTELEEGVNEIPDLMEPVQRALTLFAAIDYCVAEEMYVKANELRKMLFGDPSKPDDTGVKGLVEGLYSSRVGARRSGMKARRRSYR